MEEGYSPVSSRAVTREAETASLTPEAAKALAPCAGGRWTEGPVPGRGS